MGHYIQLRREGVRPSGMVFIPFLGAAVGTRSLGGSALAEARVGLAGPIVGSLACAALVPVAVATGDDFWRALAFTGFFLNLFNLVPLVPFDGGRAMAAMAPWMWFAGFGGFVLFFLLSPNPILIVFITAGRDGDVRALEAAAGRARRATRPTTRSRRVTGCSSARPTSP